MTYNQYTSDKDEPGSMMTVEEEFLQEVMSDDFKVVKDYRIWCSIADLYRYYIGKWNARAEPYPGDPDPKRLDRREFGAVLDVVFPNTITVDRRVNGVKHRGRACLSGPIERKMQQGGRPPKGKIEKRI